MKIVVLGGYGVFGARLVRLLVRDGHDVVVAGRSAAKADAMALDVGAKALVIDRQGDLACLWAIAPDAVVDAAGPFHGYGDDPYALARECIQNGAHYLDLADDSIFCSGISALDALAQEAGVFALSGVSSVPAISSAAVAALAQGAVEVDTISTAILPGNRAARGKAVVQSILHQCGHPFDVTMDGVKTPVRSWSRPESFDLGQGITRKGWMIEVPDHRLFPQAFNARTVLFRAGLELWVMNYGLAAFSWLRSKIDFGIADWFIRLVLWAAKLLWPLGTDTGGMSVAVTARYPDGWQRRIWRMVAKAGEGPFIPAVSARVVLRDPGAIRPGARPAVAQIPLSGIEAGMADLDVVTERLCEPVMPLFQQQLGDDFTRLPAVVQAAHNVYGPRCLAGRAKVTRGGSLWARLIGAMMRFPKATDDIAVKVTMTPQNGTEVWERQFGDQKFTSRLRLQGRNMTEKFGALTFLLGLCVADSQLLFPVLSGRLGPIPLPKSCLPQSMAREFAKDGVFHFDVAIKAPLTGALIVHYQGSLVRQDNSAAS